MSSEEEDGGAPGVAQDTNNEINKTFSVPSPAKKPRNQDSKMITIVEEIDSTNAKDQIIQKSSKTIRKKAKMKQKSNKKTGEIGEGMPAERFILCKNAIQMKMKWCQNYVVNVCAVLQVFKMA